MISPSYEDHLPAAVPSVGWMPMSARPSQYLWDDQALLDPTMCEQFRRALATLPVPKWNMAIYEK